MALNPIAYTEKVVDGFLRYQLTTYPFADNRLYDQLRRLLSLEETRRTPLLQGPFIKLSAAFKRGAAVTDLVREGVLHPHMQQLIAYSHVYGHQERAVRAIAGGRTTLVSTGTGSGKTECFLYPIISRCLQLRDQEAPSGISAVLVYPMNALAEDQLDRLRELLAGTGVTFGMYVGKTPEKRADVAGERLRVGSSREDFRRALERAGRERRETAVHPAEERCSREEMRTPGKQPRILLTNVKQLELLLTRQTDIDLFAGAGLEFIVFDEAHTFSGALGAETACLVRRLRAYCGRDAGETVCVATSATIADPKGGVEAGRDFAARFFGVQRDGVELVGEEYEPDTWGAHRALPQAPADAREALRAILDAVESEGPIGDRVDAACALLAGASLGLPKSGWEGPLFDALASNELVYQLADLLSRARGLNDLLRSLAARIGRSVSEEEILAWLALGAAARKESRPLLRPVVHGFVRGLGTTVVTFPPQHEGPALHLSREPTDGEPLCALPVLTCTTCGQHYFEHHVADFNFVAELPGGGEASGDHRVWRPLGAELEGQRVVLFDRLVGEDDGEDDDDEDQAEQPPRRPQQRMRPYADVFLCRHCGALHERGLARCEGCGRASTAVPLHVVRQRAEYPGYLTRCVSCSAKGQRRGSNYREPARPVRAVQVSDVHVLAQEMIQHAERPRLLVFADSRQDAAFQAGWMRDHARRFRIRALMWERLRQGSVSVGDLVAHLDDLLDVDDGLSRALVPEVWSEARKEAEGRRHQEERRYLLRILVLREITTGAKQRVGLEPWGRLRIDYSGLSADQAFVQRWAAALTIDPDSLVAGVAGILDQLRRRMAVLDRQHQLFSRLWDEGAREVQAGYLPLLSGVPKGVKLEREEEDRPARIMQLISARGDSFAKQAARAWGVDREHVDDFLRELWQFLVEDLRLLVPVMLLNPRGRALPGTTGAMQIDADRLRLVPHSGVYRCTTCRRAHLRMPPNSRCLAWRCSGTLRHEEESAEDYDLRLIDQQFRMVRPREHSAQIPGPDREAIERSFKGESETVNTLVCTPTLEMGVDIGALDSVLMRNVPPRAANYWQRAGRAGRRHRMAVNVTYARPTSHDQAYFGAPMKLLEGRIDPPRFNLRNELMVAKHVHATVLTRLHQLAAPNSALSDFDRQELEQALGVSFPHHIKTYLFDERSEVRRTPYDLAALRTIVTKHEAELLRSIEQVFAQGWPASDAGVVGAERLRSILDLMPDRLGFVIARLRRRLEWALAQMRRLDEIRARKGTLDAEDDEPLYRRCNRIVKRLKGVATRQRSEAEGYDDTVTLGVLAAQGFLPGYGLEVGAVIGTAEARLEFEDGRGLTLARPPSMALREFAPGNLLYANGGRFTPRVFHLEAEESPLWFRVDVEAGALSEERAAPRPDAELEAAGLGAQSVRAIPVCDVDLAHRSRIGDDEEFRFQPPMEVYGYELGQHDGGRGFEWGICPMLLRKGVRFRLANVGARRLVEAGRGLGFPICLRCGQSRSPFASARELADFERVHLERCGQRVAPTGFYADVTADALSFRAANREEAYSVLEALRFGASRVLDMELEDLQILAIGHAGLDAVDALLYDPMPGGSGLLEQLFARFAEVHEEARGIAAACPSQCTRSCIDCLQTFRNAFYHASLDRNLVVERFDTWGSELRTTHELPARNQSAAPPPAQRPVNAPERRLEAMLLRAGLPRPVAQHEIDLGRPHGRTLPDFFYPSDDARMPGTCIYLDGLSAGLHGNPETHARDRQLTALLEARNYVVFRIAASELDDRAAVVRLLYDVGKELLGRNEARALRDNTAWFDDARSEAESDGANAGGVVLPFVRVEPTDAERFVTCVPLMSLKAAAGGFGEVAAVESDVWVRPNGSHQIRPGMFVAQVVGKSMEPRIADGAYCLFSAPLLGSPNAKIALVQLRDAADPETEAAYTVKKIEIDDDEVRLLSLNGSFKPMAFGRATDLVHAVAELVAVLQSDSHGEAS